MGCIGIIGGMGPLATYDLAEKITANTRASSDQEHVHVLIDSNPAIPDRTEAILGRGPSPVPEIVASGKRLEAAGADVLAIACNTAHFFYDEVASELEVPVLNMPRETARRLFERGVSRAAILATEGTRASGVYDAALAEREIAALWPDDDGQALITHVIYDVIKAGRRDIDARAVRRLSQQLHDEGAEVLVMGCTELPIVFEVAGIVAGTIDPTNILARSAIRAAGAEPR